MADYDEIRAAAAKAATNPKTGRSQKSLDRRAERARYRQKARQAAYRRLAAKYQKEFRQMFEEELGEMQ